MYCPSWRVTITGGRPDPGTRAASSRRGARPARLASSRMALRTGATSCSGRSKMGGPATGASERTDRSLPVYAIGLRPEGADDDNAKRPAARTPAHSRGGAPMDGNYGTERYETVIIGGGQAGLATGYHLARLGRPFLILEADRRIGDSWRKRWDSLHLFTPARHDGLPGWKFPAAGWSFPSRDDMAGYLEAYAARFGLPVRTGMPVDRVTCDYHGGYLVTAACRRFQAGNVVVATGAYQDPAVVQLHSSGYRGPSQLRDGAVLVVGAGNSGAGIALESAGRRQVWLSGRQVGAIPFRIGGLPSRLLAERLMLRVVFHRVLTVKTPMGRKMRALTGSRGAPLIRVRPKQ